jgi:spermidine synthase
VIGKQSHERFVQRCQHGGSAPREAYQVGVGDLSMTDDVLKINVSV